MRRSSVITTLLFGTTMFGAAVAASDAEARLDIYVDKSAQELQVIENGRRLFVWPVSTGRDRFSTPSGVYTPERLERSWFSRAYYNSPMPHAIFFHNGYAIHGSYDIGRLGGPASHGCVRLHPRDAALLFSMVQQEGPGGTTIYVGGDSSRARLRYRDDVEQWRPVWRRDESVARGPYRPDPRIDAGPPPGELPDRYVDRRGGYPPPRGPEAAPYYEPDRYYQDGPGPYADQGPYTRAPNAAPYYETDRSGDPPRRAPRGTRVTPDYGADPYVDDRSAPRGPGFSPYYPSDRRSAVTPDHRSDEHAPGPHGPRMAPTNYADRSPGYADRPVDGPARRYVDPAPLAMQGGESVSRPAAPRFEGGAPFERVPVDQLPIERPPVERMPPPFGDFRPVPGAKPKPGHFGDEPPNRSLTAGAPARAPQQPLVPVTPAPIPAVSMPTPAPPPTPAVALPPPLQVPAPVAKQEPPPEQQESNGGWGYKVLPRSYWAGASWRWRMKRDEDSVPPPASQ